MSDIEKEIDWSKAFTGKDAVRPDLAKKVPNYDDEISRIVGKPVQATDPRLMRLVVKYKKLNAEKYKSEEVPDNNLSNPQFLVDLKKAFGVV